MPRRTPKTASGNEVLQAPSMEQGQQLLERWQARLHQGQREMRLPKELDMLLEVMQT